MLYLILTHRCNLQCKYCFVPYSFSKTETEEDMSFETAKGGIDLWIKHIESIEKDRNPRKINNEYSIIFYGGEPLLNFNTLQKSLEYIKNLQRKKKLPESIEKVVFTNGTLVSKKTIFLFKKHNTNVILSIDGPRSLNDLNRKDKKDRGSFEKAYKALKLLQKEDIKTGVSCTVSPGVVDKIPRILKFLGKENIKEFGLSSILGKPVIYLGEKNIKNYYKKWAEQLVNFYSFDRKKIGEQQINYRTKIFKEREFYPVDCLGYGGELAIQPNGYVGNCHASSRYNIRHIDKWGKDLLIKNDPKVKRVIKRLPLYNKLCLDCKAISMCGGGCFWNATEIKGDYLKKDERMCSLTKEIFEFLIWEQSDKIKIG